MTIHPDYIGCDISKSFLDVHDPATGADYRIANTYDAISDFAVSLEGRDVIVVLEATGVYDRVLRDTLAQAGVGYVRINPTRARRFAQVLGLLAKTDRIDARMLSNLGRTIRPEPDLPDDLVRRDLKDLQKRRDQLVQMRADEKKRRHDADGDIRRSVEAVIDCLTHEVEVIDREIAALIKCSETLKAERVLLLSAPGVGDVTSNVLLAAMPELGRLSPKKIASLAGLAPFNQDSGTMRGKRRIRGGRGRVRRALYMAALTAIRHDQRFADLHQRILRRSQLEKVAIVAAARKLLTILNAMVRDGKEYV